MSYKESSNLRTHYKPAGFSTQLHNEISAGIVAKFSSMIEAGQDYADARMSSLGVAGKVLVWLALLAAGFAVPELIEHTGIVGVVGVVTVISGASIITAMSRKVVTY